MLESPTESSAGGNIVDGSFEALFLTLAQTIGIVVIVGAAGALGGLFARALRDRFSSHRQSS